jgi:hypothetical protein
MPQTGPEQIFSFSPHPLQQSLTYSYILCEEKDLPRYYGSINAPYIFFLQGSFPFTEVAGKEGSIGLITGLQEPCGRGTNTSLVAEIHLLLYQVQALGVILKSDDRIRQYLLRFPDLLDVIPRAIGGVRRHLPESQLFFDVYHDPEMEDEYLILYVRLKNYDVSVIERIEAAEREYIDLLAQREGWLQVSTDFRGAEPA